MPIIVTKSKNIVAKQEMIQKEKKIIKLGGENMAEYFIDSLGDMCPVPNLKVQSKIKQLLPGDQIILLTDHSCAVTTIVDEMKRKRFKTKVEEVENGVWRILISIPPVSKNRGSAYE